MKKTLKYIGAFLFGWIAFPVLLFLNWKNKNKDYKGCLIASGVGFAFFIIGNIIGEDTETETNVADSTEQVEKETDEVTEQEDVEEEPEQSEETSEAESEAVEPEEVEEVEEIEEIEEVEEAPEPSEVQFDPNDYNAELTYDDLARNPDEHIFKAVTFEGKIIQVMQGNDRSQYRIATNDNYDKVMLLEIDNSQLDSRILEDDYIRFWGTYIGEITYESTLGGNITIPGVIVDNFEFQ